MVPALAMMAAAAVVPEAGALAAVVPEAVALAAVVPEAAVAVPGAVVVLVVRCDLIQPSRLNRISSREVGSGRL